MWCSHCQEAQRCSTCGAQDKATKHLSCRTYAAAPLPGQHSAQPQHRAPAQAEPAHVWWVQLLQDQVYKFGQGYLRELIGPMQQSMLAPCNSSGSSSGSKLVKPVSMYSQVPFTMGQHAPCAAVSCPTIASTSSSVTVDLTLPRSLPRIVGERRALGF